MNKSNKEKIQREMRVEKPKSTLVDNLAKLGAMKVKHRKPAVARTATRGGDKELSLYPEGEGEWI